MKIEVKAQQRPLLQAGQIWKRLVGSFADHHYLVVIAPSSGQRLVMVDLKNPDQYWGDPKDAYSVVDEAFEFVGTLEVTL